MLQLPQTQKTLELTFSAEDREGHPSKHWPASGCLESSRFSATVLLLLLLLPLLLLLLPLLPLLLLILLLLLPLSVTSSRRGYSRLPNLLAIFSLLKEA